MVSIVLFCNEFLVKENYNQNKSLTKLNINFQNVFFYIKDENKDYIIFTIDFQILFFDSFLFH